MAVSDRRTHEHIVDNAFDTLLAFVELFSRRLSQAEELMVSIAGNATTQFALA